MAYNHDFNDYRVPSPANSNISHHSDHSHHSHHSHHSQQQRARAPSNAPRHKSPMSEASRYSTVQTPIDEAVNSAFDQAQAGTSNAIPPDLIAQITQNVIKQLQTGGLDGNTGTPLPPPHSPIPPGPPTAIHHPTPQHPTPHHPAPQSPSTTASGTSPHMPNRVYTPPSPQKHSEYTPLHSQSEHIPDAPQSPVREPVGHVNQRRASSPISPGSDSSEKHYTRPKGPSRLSTGKEETTLERIWGQLFDEEAHPTARLGQFLRGLAVHIIEDYEPQQSIVITPHKMAKYYDDVKLSHETYPWSTVFDDEHTSISRMYRDLECQHHLVQERFDERPDIPGLTPVGFERWVTLLIQAHPEAEFERLQKAVLEMPISNPDDKKERFPKEISRRLFPGHEDLRTRHRIEDSIAEHAAIVIPRRSSHDSLHSHSESHSRQPSPHHKASAPSENPYIPQNARPSVSFAEHNSTTSAASSTYLPSHIERERKPYSTIPSDSAIDDTNHSMPPPPHNNPIERERKPYSAQPGGGKTHEDEARVQAATATKPRAESIINNPAKTSRSDSSARARPIPIAQPRQMEVPKPEIHHHRAPSNAGAGRRHRSPSFSRGSSNDFRRSDGDIRGYQRSDGDVRGYPPTFESGSMPRGSEGAFSESDTQRYFDQQAKQRVERVRRQADSDDPRHYGESPRRDYERPIRRGDYLNDEDYYRAGGRGDKGNGYDYQQPYGGPVYR